VQGLHEREGKRERERERARVCRIVRNVSMSRVIHVGLYTSLLVYIRLFWFISQVITCESVVENIGTSACVVQGVREERKRERMLLRI